MGPRDISLPLGDLELAVMEHLWNAGSGDVRSVHRALGSESPRASNTVQSTLERLSRKGLLLRRKRSRAFVYEPALSREDLLLKTMSQIADRLGNADSQVLMASFVELASREDPGNLDHLQQLIDARRRRDGGDD